MSQIQFIEDEDFDYESLYQNVIKYLPMGFEILKTHVPKIRLQMKPLIGPILERDMGSRIVEFIDINKLQTTKKDDRLSIILSLLSYDYHFRHFASMIFDSDIRNREKRSLKEHANLYDKTPDKDKPVDFPGNPFRVWLSYLD